MKSLIVSRTGGFALLFLPVIALGWSCSQGNSGGDTVTGQGGSGGAHAGTGGTATGGMTTSSTGGSSQLTGTGGQSSLGTGGSVTAGTGGAAPGTGGSASGAAGSGTTGTGGKASGGAGTSGSGGSTGAAGSGGPVVVMPGGDSKCTAAMGAPIMATLCDGFEDATTVGTTWKTSGTIKVDSTKAYRGTKSVMFSDASQAMITETMTFTGSTKATNNEFWGRYFFLSNVTTYPISHTVFGTLAGTGNDFHFVGGSRAQLMAQIQNGNDRYTDPGGKNAGGTEPKYPTSADGWQCWEWHVQADDSYNFYINGKEVTEMALVKGVSTYSKMTLAPLPTFMSMALGWLAFGGGGTPVSGWIDEVAVGPNRIGCDN